MNTFILKYYIGNSCTNYIVKSESAENVILNFRKWMPKDVVPWKIEIEYATEADWLNDKRKENDL